MKSDRLGKSLRGTSRLGTRAVLLAIAAAIAATLAIASSAGAATYTIDGVASDTATAEASAGGCSAIVMPDGTVPCFTSEAKRDEAAAKAVKAGKIPPGWGVKATGVAKDSLLGTTASVAKLRKGKKNIARISSCTNDYNHTYTGYSQTGTYTWFGATAGWMNLASNNNISSDQTARYLHTWYHDGTNGGGRFFDQTFTYCHIDNDLRNDPFPDGGTWDNRFSSTASFLND